MLSSIMPSLLVTVALGPNAQPVIVPVLARISPSIVPPVMAPSLVIAADMVFSPASKVAVFSTVISLTASSPMVSGASASGFSLRSTLPVMVSSPV